MGQMGVSKRQMIHAYMKERPYGLLLFTAIALSLALVFLSIAYIDFQDSGMFGVPLTIMVWIIPSLLIFFWLLYLPTKRFLYSTTFTWTHILVTVSTTIILVIVLCIVFTALLPASHGYPELIGDVIRIVFIMFTIGQCTYLANVFLGLFTKANKQF
jgi:hypothetical protein